MNKSKIDNEESIFDSQLNIEEIFKNIMHIEKLSNNFPENEDYQYYKTTSAPFRSKVKDYGGKILTLIQLLIDKEKGNEKNTINLLSSSDPEEISQKYDDVIEIVDDIIEKVVCHFIK